MPFGRNTGEDARASTVCGVAGVPARMVNDQWLADQVLHPHAWIERAEWILKDDLHVAPQPPQFAWRSRAQITPIEVYGSGSRLNQA